MNILTDTARPAIALAAALALAACQSPPGSPTLPAAASPPPAWAAGANAGAPTAWLADFHDGELTSFVRQALAENPDLAAAAARLRQASARTRLAGADRLPDLASRFSAGRSKTGAAVPASSYDAGLNLSWEIDLWGRLRDRRQAAQSDASAAAADLAAARLSLAANVARGWLNLAEAEQQVALATSIRTSYTDAAAALEGRFTRGLEKTTALDLTLSRNQVSNAEATVQARTRERETARRALETLLGRYPAGTLASRKTFPALPSAVPAGLPSSLLLRRPDVRAAEFRCLAAGARVSAAQKAFLPALRLTGNAGGASPDLGQILQPEALLAGIAAGLAQPVLDSGRRSAQVALSQAERDELAAGYTSDALRAFREVETALTAETYLRAQVAALESTAASALQAEQMALTEMENAQGTLITLLETQRRSADSQSALLRARNALLQNRIDLYLALGGEFE